MLFGELVQRDRERAGLTQEDFVKKLNEIPEKDRPRDPYTKKHKIARRSWVAKIESAALQRDLRVEVREWLATALRGDIELYRTLPLVEEPQKSDPDQLKEQEEFLRASIERLNTSSQIQIDTPVSGPLANHRPHLLLFLAGIITKHDTELIIFSNESPTLDRKSPNTMQCIMLLHMIVGELATGLSAPSEAKLREHFAEQDWDEDIAGKTRRIYEAAQRSHHDKPVKLAKPVLDWIKRNLTVHILKAPPPSTARYNPLTIVLAESASSSKPAAYILDGHNRPWDLEDTAAVAKAFDDRRGLFTPFQPSVADIVAHAAQFGLKLQAPR